MDFRQMPKAELHVHLEGSVRTGTLLEIEPSLDEAQIRADTAYSDFAGFLKSYVWVNRLLREPEHYALAARRLFEEMQGQGVVYAEVTLSAGVILWKGQELGAVYDALYAESQRAPFPVYWILDAVRQFGAAAAGPVVEFASRNVERGVVAFGIGGDEARGPAREFAGVFERARGAGLRLVCHAGETCGPESVREALEVGAERIGHGIAAASEPGLMARLREQGVPLEVCLTSNVRTGVVAALDAHPLRKLFDAGVEIVLDTDDPALFDCTLESEYGLARERFGFSEDEIRQLAGNSLRHAFAMGEAGRPA